MTAKKSDKKQIIVLGADDYNLGLIKDIPGAKDWDLVPALTREDVQPASGRIDFNELYEQARSVIDDKGGEPDAIIGYLDFPVTPLEALLRQDYDLPGATPEAVARCEHKYWTRLEQRKILPDRTPVIHALNPFDPDKAKKDAPDFPFWLKPVKGHSSVLGFMVEDEKDLDAALHACRQRIHLIGEPFNQFLSRVDHDDVGHIDGNYAVAESLISADRQFTLEGYVRNGETVIYGAVDSVREGHHQSSFSRYQYPADFPEDVLEKAHEISAAFMKQVGYDGSPFNIEFFWNPETGDLHLLEVNARISKSHSPLFRMVDGVSHHKVAIELALGRKPDMPKGKGKDKVAAKFMLRSFEGDGIVKRVPSEDELADLKRILPDIDANIHVQKDVQLSTLFYQDSYSYELADIFLGGNDEEMLEDAYARCVDSLPIFIKPLPKAA